MMKKIFFFLLLISLSGCNDGDFEIPSFQFNENVQQCGTYLVYRTNSDRTEAFVLVLNTAIIKNEVSAEPLTLAISPDNTQYRIFNGPITSSYFCQTLPPATPVVLKQWDGVAGGSSFMSISTTKELNLKDELIGYKHSITLHNLRLQYNDQTITYRTFDFGTFSTPL